MVKPKTHVFPNGFRVIYEKPTNALKLTTIDAFCDIGSVFEKDGVRGISHFVEHMCFKGTSKIPNPQDIFLSYDKIGAYFNAFTEKRTTVYTIRCEDEYAENCISILGDMMLHSTIPKSHFLREQKVVLEENIKSDNSDRNILGEAIDVFLYKGSSYQFPIDTLAYHMDTTKKYVQEKDLSYKNLVDWYHSFYIPSNMVFSIVSNLSFENIKRILAKTAFTKRPIEKIPVFKREMNLSLELPLNRDKIHIISHNKGKSKNISKTNHHILIGFRTCSQTDKDKHILDLLTYILNGMSGRLFTILREKNGLTYSSSCYTEYFEHTGCFIISTQTSAKHTINGVLPLLVKLFIDLKKKGITKEELKVAKGNWHGKTVLSSESSGSIAYYNGWRYLIDPTLEHFVPFMDYYEKFIEPLTVEQINDIIRRYFTVENMVIGIRGNDAPSVSVIEKVAKDFS